MRRMLTLAALTLAMVGTAGLPACDSGCVAGAQDRPVGAPDRPQVVPAQDGKADKRRIRQPVDYIYPPPLNDRRRGPLRGDFWADDEIKQIFDSRQSFGR
jgi:hypothetical protein